MTRPRLIIVSGPSGAGKSTVVRKLIEECPLPLTLSVSATTRAPRKGEINGQNYHFVSEQEFTAMKDAGEFLECKEVFGQNWYGTQSSQVNQGLEAGNWVILEIDVQGALTVMQQRDDAVSFFVHPGSSEELEHRLRRRGTDGEAAILRRLAVAQEEMEKRHHYHHEIINRNVDQAVAEICELLQQL